MANVGFKQGLQAKFNELNNFDTGSFYLTTDTERLYYAKSSTTAVELNRSIRFLPSTVTQTSEITGYTLADGDIFYMSSKNALIIYRNGNWAQINPDTFLLASTSAVAVSASGNNAVIGIAVSDTKNGSNAEHSATGNFILKQGNNVTISANSSTREITIGSSYVNSTYDLKTAAGSTANEALIKLVGTNPASTATVKVKADGTMVEVVGDANGNITIKGKKPITALNSQFDANGALGIEAVLNDGTTASTEIAPRIVYGQNGSASAVFASGTATLDVYTREQVDNKVADVLRSADALVFKGAVASSTSASSILSASATNAGDTYKATAEITGVKIGTGSSDTATAQKGDLLIVTKNDSGTKYWTIVPSGDEEEIAFGDDFGSTANTSITIGSKFPEDSNLSNGHTLKINGASSVTNSNNLIVVTPTVSGNTKTLTISHGKATGGTAIASTSAVSQTVLSPSSVSSTLVIPVISDIVKDAAGHIVSATKTTYTVVDTHGTFEFPAALSEVATSGTATVGKFNLSTKFDGHGSTNTLAIRSSSLTIAKASTDEANPLTAGLDINLEWGTF